MMKKYFISLLLWMPLLVNAGDGLIALYPPVKTSYQGNEIVVSFLSTGGRAPAGVIYAISLPSLASTFIRAPASVGEGEIILEIPSFFETQIIPSVRVYKRCCFSR